MGEVTVVIVCVSVCVCVCVCVRACVRACVSYHCSGRYTYSTGPTKVPKESARHKDQNKRRNGAKTLSLSTQCDQCRVDAIEGYIKGRVLGFKRLPKDSGVFPPSLRENCMLPSGHHPPAVPRDSYRG